MKLLPRRSADPTAPPVDLERDELAGSAPKGRPTPKRRDAAPRRTTITEPPRNRKEAYRWQKEQAERARTSPSAAPVTREAQRAAMARGDESALTRRDRGPLRRLARNWVDSHRMLSNWLLLLFPLMIVGAAVPYVTIAVFVLLLVFVGEWYLTGRKVIALARERGIEVRSGPMGLGFYAGSRAYMPRKWRMPKPQVQLGDAI